MSIPNHICTKHTAIGIAADVAADVAIDSTIGVVVGRGCERKKKEKRKGFERPEHGARTEKEKSGSRYSCI